MGGDGGTISSNRAYLRGAGKAGHTADHKRYNASRSKEEESESARTVLGSCYLSGEAFDLSPSSSEEAVDVVACPFGRLYKREHVLEALLSRSSKGVDVISAGSAAAFERIMHIRGRKDLHPVRFHITKEDKKEGYVVTCPITGSDIGGGSIPSFLIVKSCTNSTPVDDADNANTIPNVISERGMQEMGIDRLHEEYGPFEKKDLIRLAPQQGLFEEIRKKWEERMEADRLEKLNKKKEKKRKRADDHASKKTSSSRGHEVTTSPTKNNHKHSDAHHPKNNMQQQTTKVSSSLPTAAQEARSSVRSAVESNSVLSNLFGSKKNSSEKERRDALFTRNC